MNTYVDIQEYGWIEGNYWWFCNLALFGMGLALFLKDRGLLTGFLSIASFTQTFWLVDNIYRQSTGLSLFGLTDFMYRPGYPLSKFVLSHYHYFTLLIGAYALCFLPKKKNRTLLYIAIFNPFIFGVSYFVFGPSQNVNCIHSSCLPSLIPGDGPVFALCFWAVVFGIHLFLGRAMDRFFLNFEPAPAKRKWVHSFFMAGFAIAVGLSFHDLEYRKTMPQFICKESQANEGVIAGCKFTKPLTDKEFLLTYFVGNNGYEDKVCDLFMSVDGQESILEESTNVFVGSELSQGKLMPQPQKDMVVEFKTKCHRVPASVSSPPAQ
ncbi:MAG: hypothetical protein EBQ85_03570 [Proteobacteria bacterium]|nr:hypothetical protein [Pseudomonadota bacterium]